MKQDIDTIVRNIHQNLKDSGPSDNSLNVTRAALEVDRLTVAGELRDVLVAWTEDGTLPTDVQAYARQQLDALPGF